MKNTIFEQMNGTYEQQGDYLIPNLTVTTEEEKPIGIWGCGCPVDTSKRSLEAPTEPTGETAAFEIFKTTSQSFIL